MADSSLKQLVLKIWRWSWLLTLPVCLLLGTWLYLTVDRYYTFFVRYRPITNVSLWQVGSLEFQHLLRNYYINLFHSGPNHLDELKQVDLFISATEQEKLTARMPSSGFHYVKAGLAYNDKVHEVKMRYRGDHFYHWAGYKKSMRIKTKKDNMYENMRAFNLIIPKTKNLLNNYLGYQLAADLGLMTPITELVNVNINDERQGLYILVEQLEEIILRKHHRMPGDIYRGDHIGSSIYRGITDHLFNNANLWEKIAVNNHYPPDHNKALKDLLAILGSDDSQRKYQQLNKLLDIDAFARFNIFETLTSTYHYDNNHNWHLYYDPAKEKFEPLVWDPVAWHPGMMPREGEGTVVEVISSDLMHALFKNGEFVRKRNTYLLKFFNSQQHDKFIAKVEAAVDLLKKGIVYDPNIKELTVATYLRGLDAMKNNILKTFTGLKQEYAKESRLLYQQSDENKILINITGRYGVNNLVLGFQHAVVKPERIILRYKLDGRWIEEDVGSASYIEDNRLVMDIALSANSQAKIKGMKGHYVTRQNHLVFQPAYYELLFTGMDLDLENQLLELSAASNNTTVQGQQAESIRLTDFKEFYQFTESHVKAPPLIWQGKVHIKHIQQMNREVVIRPGTQIMLHENASLIFNNKLSVEGSQTDPVRFMAVNPDKPWGAVVVKGQQASGSQFQYCRFSDGSGLKRGLFEYSAMLSLHDTSGITIDNCIFSQNHRVDDMVHGVYTDVHIRASEFRGAKFDAVDLDISRGIIENSLFIDNGNDSLDLMDSYAVVINSKIINSIDKGISVGEGTRLLALNNSFINNGIALQSKDGSRALVLNNYFKDNIKALDAYKKNWRYNAGGYFHVSNNQFTNNESLLTVDRESDVEVFGVALQQLIIHKNIQAELQNMDDDRLQGLLNRYYREPVYLPYWTLAGISSKALTAGDSM